MQITNNISIKQPYGKVNFKSKNIPASGFLNAVKIDEQLAKISKNEDTKKIFAGLTALAGSMMASLALAAENNSQAQEFFGRVISEFGLDKENDVTERFEKLFNNDKNSNELEAMAEKEKQKAELSSLIEQKPERDVYLKITSYFPNLSKQYINLLESQLGEDDSNKTLFILENVLDHFAEPERLNNMKPYLQVLDEHADILDEVTENIISTLRGGNSIMYYLVLLNNGKLSKEDIKLWAKENALSCDEFMMFKNLDKQIIEKINNVKLENPDFNITDLSAQRNKKYDCDYYIFKSSFDSSLTLPQKLKTITKIHEALHGPTYLKENIDRNDYFLKDDIKSEMADSLVKNKNLEVLYNFIKYAKPKALKHIQLTSNEVKKLSPDDNKYKEIKNICARTIMHLNFDSPEIQELCNVLNNDDLFGGIIKTRHAKLRFINRFVLKDNPSTDLAADTKLAMDVLKQKIEESLPQYSVLCMINAQGKAPHIHVNWDSKENSYIKITLNNEGSIHTLYEEFRKEPRKEADSE